MMGPQITDNIADLKAVLPDYLIRAIEKRGREHELIEIVLDVGRLPTARYVSGEVVLHQTEIQPSHLEHIVKGLGDFDSDNRAGIERTLHRISAIRNRRGDIVGLTCRIGRAVYGTIDIIKDIIEAGQSVLIVGPPGVGKTTMLREAARVLAEKRRVIIVDTSNEIGGDGDVPHPAVGRARRMQVAQPQLQHEVMIEAVENHNPEVIVIDEIGRELEALAARTIAERGVQLIGTAHGNSLENLLMNPTLSDLVGGIESVTLSDEEARRRGTQKSVLERRAPPTFDVLVELQTRDRLILHNNVAEAVDALLRDKPPVMELRYRDEAQQIHIEPYTAPRVEKAKGSNLAPVGAWESYPATPLVAPALPSNKARKEREVLVEGKEGREREGEAKHKPLKAYVYGIARNRLAQSSKRLNVPLNIVDDVEEAHVIITLKSYYRRRPKPIADAEKRGKSVYVLRANTVTQMEDFLFDVFNLQEREGGDGSEALREAEDAIAQIRFGERSVDLRPQPDHMRRRQHELARQANLISHSYGVEPHRYVRILNPQMGAKQR
jgi:stage III sporulation protein SpoIIIAA